jgi:hypothetical protein
MPWAFRAVLGRRFPVPQSGYCPSTPSFTAETIRCWASDPLPEPYCLLEKPQPAHGPSQNPACLLTFDKIGWAESGWVLEAHAPDRTLCPACQKVRVPVTAGRTGIHSLEGLVRTAKQNLAGFGNRLLRRRVENH